MGHVDHFSYGALTPVLAYVMSCMGSLLGLLCMTRAREAEGRSRAKWLAVAALAIGGTGIWVMHFIAMLGFRVSGMQIRYDVPLTLLSALVSVVVVGTGLFIVAYGGFRLSALLGGGLLTGAGVAAMHYLGMSAMNMPGHIDYAPLTVTASVAIALAAATAALWFAVHARGLLAITAASAIMGVAVTGMHYTGMFAVHVHPDPAVAAVGGAQVAELIGPLIVGISLVALLLLLIIAVNPPEEDLTKNRRRSYQAEPPPPAPTTRGERPGSLFDGSG
ncbi:MHYT domain-containing protein [Actinomadura sp. 9N407]|uniref:MHYT domain-containing protein n=1 Tax=Actinomadura sp. 9N407 TaxID=3375154 RepID=UPI0037BAD32B